MSSIITIRRAMAFASLAIVIAACGSSNAASKVATLSTGDPAGAATTTTLSAKDSQDAILAYAACMRENGVPMQDPTFDANGTMTGGGCGRDSGIDPRSTEFQTAQDACGSLIEGIDFGRGRRGNFDPAAIQSALSDFTSCLREQGLQVDDITLPQPGAGGPGGANAGSLPVPDGSIPPGGFDGPPPSFQGGGNVPGGAGFDPTTRMIEQLGLDATDPAVKAALDICQPILTKAFQPTTSTTTG
jgi:hypothetical protein